MVGGGKEEEEEADDTHATKPVFYISLTDCMSRRSCSAPTLPTDLHFFKLLRTCYKIKQKWGNGAGRGWARKDNRHRRTKGREREQSDKDTAQVKHTPPFDPHS